jgi:hypothetical protein
VNVRSIPNSTIPASLTLVTVAAAQTSGLESTPTWTATGQDGDLFGHVARAGDLDQDGHFDFVVGAPHADTPQTPSTDEGEVLVYRGGPNGLSSVPWFRIEGDQTGGSRFGSVCGSAGDVNGDGWVDLFVASPLERVGPSIPGAVRVFHGGPTGPITGVDLVPGDANWYADGTGYGSAQFGTSVAAVGDVDGNGCDDLLIGAPFANGTGGSNCGVAFLFLGMPVVGLGASPAWSVHGTVPLMNLGDFVFAAGDPNRDGARDFVVHALNDGGLPNEGHIWMWHGVHGGLPASGLAGAWLDSGPPGGVTGSGFGTAIAAADFDFDGFDDLAIGMFQALYGGCACGVVFAYRGGPDSNATQQLVPFPLNYGGYPNFQHARSLAAGDFDGDTLADLAVGVPGASSTAGAFGEVHVFYAGLCSLPQYCGLGGPYHWSSGGTQNGQQYGIALACIGDSDRDGADELLIGAPATTVVNGTAGDGQAWLFDGIVVGPVGGCVDEDPAWLIPGTQPDGLMGIDLECADFTGDGKDDFLVTDYEPGNEHVVRLHRGSASGPESAPVWEVAGPPLARSNFGWSLADAGDMDGDLDHEILISDHGSFWGGYGSTFGFEPGYVRLYLGGSPPSTTHVWEARAIGPGPIEFGHACAGVGDLNHDGFLDVAVSAQGHTATWPGDPYPFVYPKVYVYFGPHSGTDDETTADCVITSDQYDDLGWSIARAGDVNGDTHDDLLVGAPLRDGSFNNGGAALLWFGGPSAFFHGATLTPAMANWAAEGQWNDGLFGFAVESGQSLFGNARPEVAVGAPYDTTTGSVSVFYNSSTSGLATTPNVVLRGQHPNYNVGTGVRMLPRFNGDSWADLAIHGNVTNPEPLEGRVFVHFGSASGISTVANWWVESDVRGGVFGHSNRFDGGDLDGDTLTDLVGGCPGWPGDVLQHDQPGAVMAWRGTMRSQLHVEPTIFAALTPIAVQHHGGKPGAIVYCQIIAVDGVQLATPRTLVKGPSDAERCFVAGGVSTLVLSSGHVYSLRCLTRSDSGAVIRSQTVHVTVL